jgi:predicted kinase
MDRSQAVFVLTGVMSAGKSTVPQLLAERFSKAAHIRGDVFRRMIVAERRDMTSDADSETDDQLALRYRLAAATTETYFEAGFTVIVQDIRGDDRRSLISCSTPPVLSELRLLWSFRMSLVPVAFKLLPR